MNTTTCEVCGTELMTSREDGCEAYCPEHSPRSTHGKHYRQESVDVHRRQEELGYLKQGRPGAGV